MEILIYVMAAGLLGCAVSHWRQRKEIQNLEGRVLSLDDSLIISRSKEGSLISQLTEMAAKLRATQEALREAQRAAIVPEAPVESMQIRSELEPKEVQTKVSLCNFPYKSQAMEYAAQHLGLFLLKSGYIKADEADDDLTVSITVLKVK